MRTNFLSDKSFLLSQCRGHVRFPVVSRRHCGELQLTTTLCLVGVFIEDSLTASRSGIVLSLSDDVSSPKYRNIQQARARFDALALGSNPFRTLRSRFDQVRECFGQIA